MRFYKRVTNIIHTDPGILQGFTFRTLVLSLYTFGKLFYISIPYKILSYNRKEARELNNLILRLKGKGRIK